MISCSTIGCKHRAKTGQSRRQILRRVLNAVAARTCALLSILPQGGPTCKIGCPPRRCMRMMRRRRRPCSTGPCAANATFCRTGLLTRPEKEDGSGDPSYGLDALAAQMSVGARMAEGREVLVHLTPRLAPPEQLAGGVAVVIDVFRATTTLVHALAAGCSAVRPVPSDSPSGYRRPRSY